MTTSIHEVEYLEPYSAPLAALGYETLEQLVSAARVVGPEIEAYLNVNIDVLLNSLPAPAAIDAAVAATINNSDYALGVALKSVPSHTFVPAINFPLAPAALPSSVNLITEMPPIRNQNPRGTCVVHATLAVLEHFLRAQNAFQDMSEQFLYWNCKRYDGKSNEEGTWLGIAFAQLRLEGCCRETTWQYQPIPMPTNWGQGPPPDGARLEALSFRSPGVRDLLPTSVADIKAHLATRNCVAFSIPAFDSWYRCCEVIRTGDILMPIPGEIVPDDGHAMCMVGYEDLPNRPEIGGGRFIIRNSWGNTWGIESPFGVGYGTIPYGFIAGHGREAYHLPL